MCIGTPMKVVSSGHGIAVAAGRGQTERLNTLMVGEPARHLGAGLPGFGAARDQRRGGGTDRRRARRAGRGAGRRQRHRRPFPRPDRSRAAAARAPAGNPLMSAIPMPVQAGADIVASYPLVAQLFSRHGCVEVRADAVETFLAQAGHALLVFTEDPVRFKETLDLAVIVPELQRAFPGSLRVGVLLPAAARKVAAALRLQPLAGARGAQGRPVCRRHRRPAQLGRLSRRPGRPARSGADASADGGHRGARGGHRRRRRRG